MRVLLLNPSVNLKKLLGEYDKLMEPMPCIGLAYIAAVLEKNGVEVQVIDDFAVGIGLEGIMEKIREFKPDMVGISVLTPSANSAYTIAEAIRHHDKKIRIIFGNLHSSLFAKDILEKNLADFVVLGEGESTITELVSTLEVGGDIENVSGIMFKRGKEIIRTKPREIIKDLDSLPYPAWHLFPHEKYGALPFVNIKRPILGLLGSRGCPYSCTFCSPKYFRNIYRKRSAKSICDEIEHLIENFGAKQIAFMDLIFPLTKEQGMEFCDEMIRRGLHKKVVWTTETRVNSVDKELLKRMKEAGCGRIMYGIESGVQELLDKIKKGFTLEQIRTAVKDARDVNLSTVGFFMLGLPGETKERSQQTIDFSKEIGLDFAKFAITTPFPGSQLFEDAVNEGKIDVEKIRNEDWVKFSAFNPEPKNLLYVPDAMTAEEVVMMHKKANKDFYLRPTVILNQLFRIRTVKFKDMAHGMRAFFKN